MHRPTRNRTQQADTGRHARVTRCLRTASRPGPALGAAVLAVSLLAGCSGSGSPDFCAQYEELSAAAEELRAKDPAGDAEELRAAAENVQVELDDFQEVADGPLDDALTQLRANVDEARQAAADAGEQAQPQVEEAMTRIQEAWAVVESLAVARCPTS